MPTKMTVADRKARKELHAVLLTMPARRLERTPKKQKRVYLSPQEKRIEALKRARAIIAVAALSSWKNDYGHYDAPNYYKIATSLGLDKHDADLADKLWNDVNGADEGRETEENAMERVNDLLEMEKDG